MKGYNQESEIVLSWYIFGIGRRKGIVGACSPECIFLELSREKGGTCFSIMLTYQAAVALS